MMFMLIVKDDSPIKAVTGQETVLSLQSQIEEFKLNIFLVSKIVNST